MPQATSNNVTRNSVFAQSDRNIVNRNGPRQNGTNSIGSLPPRYQTLDLPDYGYQAPSHRSAVGDAAWGTRNTFSLWENGAMNSEAIWDTFPPADSLTSEQERASNRSWDSATLNANHRSNFSENDVSRRSQHFSQMRDERQANDRRTVQFNLNESAPNANRESIYREFVDTPRPMRPLTRDDRRHTVSGAYGRISDASYRSGTSGFSAETLRNNAAHSTHCQVRDNQTYFTERHGEEYPSDRDPPYERYEGPKKSTGARTRLITIAESHSNNTVNGFSYRTKHLRRMLKVRIEMRKANIFLFRFPKRKRGIYLEMAQVHILRRE